MNPGHYDLVIQEAVGYDKRWVWSTEDAAGVVTPVNLTGWTAKIQLRERYESTTSKLDLTTANGKIVLGGAAGTIDVTISKADADALGPTWRGVWDIVLTPAGGMACRLLKGDAYVARGATR
jgi:hypothetical protein